jgi:hypothetical protein
MMYEQYQESGTILPFFQPLTIRVTGTQHVMNHVLFQALHQGLRSATNEGAFQTLHVSMSSSPKPKEHC